MELVDEAVFARARRERERAGDLLRQAYENERQAATMVADSVELEPTRSVLLRSAASLALECGEPREAERLIAIALAGNPAEQLIEELRDLLEQVYFQRHLALRGIALDPTEFQLSIAGQAIGFGMAESEHLVGRVQHLQTVVYRTAERKRGREFRERGRRSDALQNEVQLYLSAPRAASFAITCKIGTRQMAFPEMDFVQEVVDEVIDCFDLFGAGQEQSLRERIPDPAYYRNFVGLARRIAPDGEDVRTVGITAVKADQERRVVLSTPRRRTPRPVPRQEGLAEPPPRVEVRGVLKFSDSRDERRGIIQVVDERNASHRIRVPSGMMRDIVRPMYEDEVIVTARRRRSGGLMLETIDPA
jgi:hypothetical protein